MVLYGQEKVRQMSRSILPSTKRKVARKNLTAVKRKNRRTINQRLARAYDMEFDGDITYYPIRDIREVMFERRAADKLNHYMRWAVERTRNLPDPETRLGYMKALLPQGLIGDHALSHLRFLDEFDTNPVLDFRYYSSSFYDADGRRFSNAERKEKNRLASEEVLEGMMEKIRTIVAKGNHRELNSRIRRAHSPYHTTHRWQARECVDCERPRYLLGLHDVEAFARHLRRTRHSEWRDTLDALV